MVKKKILKKVAKKILKEEPLEEPNVRDLDGGPRGDDNVSTGPARVVEEPQTEE